MKESTFGLALSGGGARAIAHLGLLKFLEEKKVSIHLLSGTSAGALIATLWAKGYAAQEILEIFQKFSFREILQYNFSRGFFSQKKLYKTLENFFPKNDFSALSKRVFIACTDLKSAKSIYFSEGKLIEPLLGTLAIPPLMKPIEFNDYQLLDGGILDNLPAKTIRPYCDVLLASHCNPASHKATQTMREAIERSFVLVVAQNIKPVQEIAEYFFEPPQLADFRFADLKKLPLIFEIAYNFAKNNLDI